MLASQADNISNVGLTSRILELIMTTVRISVVVRWERQCHACDGLLGPLINAFEHVSNVFPGQEPLAAYC